MGPSADPIVARAAPRAQEVGGGAVGGGAVGGGEGVRRLLHNHDGTVELRGELELVCDCRGLAADAAVRGVSSFAFAVSGVVGSLAATGVAPRPVGLFAVGWVAAALAARRWAVRRRAEHGTFTIDFDRGEIRRRRGSALSSLPLDEEVRIELEDDAAPEDHPRWLILRRKDVRLRLARGTAEDLRRVLFVLRRQGLRAPIG